MSNREEQDRLSKEDAKLLIKSIEEIEREEATEESASTAEKPSESR